MRIQSKQEAMFVACQMEESAVQLYTRALTLLENEGKAQSPLATLIREIREDEREHLRQFRSFYEEGDASLEERLTLSATAEGILFEGGLMGAVRRGLLKDMDSMLRYAMQAEENSAEKYREFAAAAGNEEVCAVLQGVACEEEKHLSALRLRAKEIG